MAGVTAAAVARRGGIVLGGAMRAWAVVVAGVDSAMVLGWGTILVIAAVLVGARRWASTTTIANG